MCLTKTDNTVKKGNHTGLPSKDETLLNIFSIYSFLCLNLCFTLCCIITGSIILFKKVLD